MAVSHTEWVVGRSAMIPISLVWPRKVLFLNYKWRGSCAHRCSLDRVLNQLLGAPKMEAVWDQAFETVNACHSRRNIAHRSDEYNRSWLLAHFSPSFMFVQGFLSFYLVNSQHRNNFRSFDVGERKRALASYRIAEEWFIVISSVSINTLKIASTKTVQRRQLVCSGIGSVCMPP